MSPEWNQTASGLVCTFTYMYIYLCIHVHVRNIVESVKKMFTILFRFDGQNGTYRFCSISISFPFALTEVFTRFSVYC